MQLNFIYLPLFWFPPLTLFIHGWKTRWCSSLLLRYDPYLHNILAIAIRFRAPYAQTHEGLYQHRYRACPFFASICTIKSGQKWEVVVEVVSWVAGKKEIQNHPQFPNSPWWRAKDLLPPIILPIHHNQRKHDTFLYNLSHITNRSLHWTPLVCRRYRVGRHSLAILHRKTFTFCGTLSYQSFVQFRSTHNSLLSTSVYMI